MLMSTIARMNMRQHEQKVMKYYDDMGPGKGNCTFGIGTLVHRGPCTTEELKIKVTDAQVEAAFVSRVGDAERAVERNVKVPLTQAQFDALVSLTFNRGPSGSFHAYQLINEGKMQAAAMWISTLVQVKVKNKGHWVAVKASGLVRRRAEESAPFRSTE